MNKTYQLAILYVDDEEASLKYFRLLCGKEFQVYVAVNGAEALKVIDAHGDHLGAIFSDQRMPGMSGVELLGKLRQTHPLITRVLVTAFDEIDKIKAAVNAAAIFSYVSKPWEVRDLRVFITRALDYSILRRERDELMDMKLSALHQMLTLDRVRGLAALAAGLNCHFRHSLTAVQAYLDAEPKQGVLRPSDGIPFSIGKNMESRVRGLNEFLGRVAAGLWEVSKEGDFSASARPLKGYLDQALFSPQGSVAAATWKASPDLPSIKASAVQIAALVHTLAAKVRQVSNSQETLHLEAAPSTAKGIPILSLTFHLEGGDWTEGQISSFFAISAADGQPGPAEAKLNLVGCYIVAHHHGGTIEVVGKSNRLVVLKLAVDPASVAVSERRGTQFQQLLQGEHGLDEMFAATRNRAGFTRS